MLCVKAVVEVSEEGAEAAAATAVVVMAQCMPASQPFVAEHPFMFCIIDNRTDVILFSGHVLNLPPVQQPKYEPQSRSVLYTDYLRNYCSVL